MTNTLSHCGYSGRLWRLTQIQVRWSDGKRRSFSLSSLCSIHNLPLTWSTATRKHAVVGPEISISVRPVSLRYIPPTSLPHWLSIMVEFHAGWTWYPPFFFVSLFILSVSLDIVVSVYLLIWALLFVFNTYLPLFISRLNETAHTLPSIHSYWFVNPWLNTIQNTHIHTHGSQNRLYVWEKVLCIFSRI